MGSFANFANQVSNPTESLERQVEKSLDRWPERWFRPRVKNENDVYFIRGLIDVTLAMAFPLASLLLCGHFTVFAGIFFILSFQVTASRYENLDHTDIHNNVFRFRPVGGSVERAILMTVRIYARWILNCICLRVPQLYRIQHLYIHHVENNGVEDNQTTILHDRKSFFDFCHFALTCAFDTTLAISTSLYLAKRNRSKLIWRILAGFFVWAIYLGSCELISKYTVFFF